MTGPYTENGFTLVEVLVAFAILAVSLGVLTSALSNSALTLNALGARQEAILLAQSKLAEAMPEQSTDIRTEKGKTKNGLKWTLETVPYGSREDREAWMMEAYAVTATVAYPGRLRGGSFSLLTLKLRPKP